MILDEERIANDYIASFGRGKDCLQLSYYGMSHDYERIIDYNAKPGNGWGMHSEGAYGCSQEGHTVTGNGGPFVYDSTRGTLTSMMSSIDIDEFVVWYMAQELSNS